MNSPAPHPNLVACVTMFGVGELIWSAVAVVASIGMTAVVVYFMFVGRDDRAREEEAREFFDRHGYWPDEDPT